MFMQRVAGDWLYMLSPKSPLSYKWVEFFFDQEFSVSFLYIKLSLFLESIVLILAAKNGL